MSTHRNGGAAVVETLAAHGVDTVFGIPGIHNLELYRHLRDARITPVTPRHEQGAGYAADGYARVTGRPGVVVTTTGPGLTNAMTAAATAYGQSQPMLVLSPGMPTDTVGRDLGRLHETEDSSAAMDRLVRWSRRVHSADEAADAVADAFASFCGARPRPVHIELPVDVLEQEWGGRAPVCAPPAAPVADPAALRRAAELLAASERPLVIAGGGAVGASAQLTALVQALGAPIATTVDGKGVVDDGHPLSVGASVRLRALQAAAAESDVLLVVGSELGDCDLWGGRVTAATVIRADVEQGQLHKNCPADLALLGEAAATSGALLDAVPPWRSVMGVARAAKLRAACREEALVDGGGYEEVNDAVRDALPADGVLTGDSSQLTYFGSAHFFPLPAPRLFCHPPGYAALGYGLPAAIGASLARPGRPVAALLGDGAFLSSVQELATAVQLRLPLPIVVADDSGSRELREQQDSRGIPAVGVDRHVPDLAALAPAMGAHGVRATDADDLTELVTDAFEADRPTVIVLRTE